MVESIVVVFIIEEMERLTRSFVAGTHHTEVGPACCFVFYLHAFVEVDNEANSVFFLVSDAQQQHVIEQEKEALFSLLFFCVIKLDWSFSMRTYQHLLQREISIIKQATLLPLSLLKLHT
jgi:hypothetical protein